MAPRGLPRPTDAELQILRVLWKIGPATVRQVLERLGPGRKIGYTTVLKLMQIMMEKKLVRRDDSQRSHVYAAASGEVETQGRLLDDLLRKAFGGSAARLVLQALSSKPASAEEVAEIRRALDELQDGPLDESARGQK